MKRFSVINQLPQIEAGILRLNPDPQKEGA